MVLEKVKVIGGARNFWIWSKRHGYDLTHPPTPSSQQIYPRIALETAHERAAIDPKKSALVIVDLQNYFLSPLLGRPSNSIGLQVADKLVAQVIPACRKANIPIVWLGWGLTDEDLDTLPPSIIRGFGLDENFESPGNIPSLGHEIGPLKLPDGKAIEGGRVMMRKQWNTEFYPTLVEHAQPQDIWVSKNRLSGFWGGTAIEDALHNRGIRTLLFSGVSTDQCVASSMQDAYTRGWDVLLLNDACGTSSPEFAVKSTEFNCGNGWGFVLTCQQLIAGIDGMKTGPDENDEFDLEK
ncbi:Peroxyureidoacrylate/ureidoacrylate amidohydrolase RutB [Paramyrothecium foliicola]|nr:Peroxyureidoacrylate/ureidoacrylate amidohydrolase RutB [Paramyrothecium foliicola]